MSKRLPPTNLAIAEVIAAFARTGFAIGTSEPFVDYRSIPDPGPGPRQYACAVGAVAIDRKRKPTSQVFGRRTVCMGMGWDDAFDNNVHDNGDGKCPHCSRKRCVWYQAGAAAAVAMGA